MNDVASWKIKARLNPNNIWVAFELFKAMKESGMFKHKSEVEIFQIVEKVRNECHITKRAVFNGWQEFLSLSEGNNPMSYKNT